MRFLRRGLLAIAIFAAPALAHAEVRVALVIGNANYDSVPRLTNPTNDASAVAATLRRIGFKVELKNELGYDALRRALIDFSRDVQSADVALVYYAGHGIEADHKNYLIPVDAKLATASGLELEAVPLDYVLSSVAGARRLRIVILDACRNNPFARQMVGDTRAIGDRGLAPIEPVGDTLVVYSAKDGTAAKDGSDANSPFAKALTADLEMPGLEIDLLFRKVRDDVVAATNSQQVPAIYGSLSATAYYFIPPTGKDLPPPAPDPNAVELAFWNSMQNSLDENDYNVYLAKYPNGLFASLARNRLLRIHKPPANQANIAPVPPAAPAQTSAASAGPLVSAAVGRLLKPAQDAMAANDYASALVLIKQAQALPVQTPFDTYKINEFAGNVYVHQNDHVNADLAYEAMVDSTALYLVTPEEKASAIRIAALLATEQKHYAQGIKFAKAFIALGGPPDALVLASLSQAYYFTNDFDNAEAAAQRAIDSTQAGQAPNRGALDVKFGSQIKAKRQDAALETLETILTYYDDPDDWAQLVDVSLGTKGIKNVDALHMYRLRFAAKAPGQSDDYTIAAAVALANGYPVEAQAILEAGLAAGKVIANGKIAQQIADTRSRAAKDRETIAAFDALARKSASGEFDLKLAETYYGYGRYAEAEEAARRALTKGGTAMDANEAHMVLGEVLALQGRNGVALTEFSNVRGASAGMMKAQHLWTIYAGRKTATT